MPPMTARQAPGSRCPRPSCSRSGRSSGSHPPGCTGRQPSFRRGTGTVATPRTYACLSQHASPRQRHRHARESVPVQAPAGRWCCIPSRAENHARTRCEEPHATKGHSCAHACGALRRCRAHHALDKKTCKNCTLHARNPPCRPPPDSLAHNRDGHQPWRLYGNRALFSYRWTVLFSFLWKTFSAGSHNHLCTV